MLPEGYRNQYYELKCCATCRYFTMVVDFDRYDGGYLCKGFSKKNDIAYVSPLGICDGYVRED